MGSRLRVRLAAVETVGLARLRRRLVAYGLALAITSPLASISDAAPSESDLAKREQTRELMQALLRGIFGDVSSVGYLGDMGRPPAALEELAAGTGSPAYSTANLGNVGMGFGGPYAPAASMAAGVYVDAWGSPIAMEIGSGALRLVSSGPDRDPTTTSDNVVAPITPKATQGSIEVEVVAMNPDGSLAGPLDSSAVSVSIYSASDGSQTSAAAAYAPGAGRFLLSGVHLGRHHVAATALDPDAYDVSSDAAVTWLRGRSSKLTLRLRLAEEAEPEPEAPADPEEPGDSVVCHKPNGPKPQTKVVPSASVSAHLGHGDTMGPCPGD